MSFSPDITPANQAKLECYPRNIQDSIISKIRTIIDPNNENGFFFTKDIKKADAYISSLPEAIHDLPDYKLQERAKALINLRESVKSDTFTPRQKDLPYVLRGLRKQQRQQREREMILFNQVHLYSSWRAERDSKQQADRATDILSKRFLKTEKGHISMDEIAKKGAECHTWETLHRLSALADIMTENSWKALFSVVTLPSRFHPKSKKWDGTMPDDAHAWANKKWANVLATLSQMGYDEGIDWMGVRTPEPHKDGCPHYNYVIIGSINLLKDVNRILHEKYLYASDADGDEKGAKEKRITTTISSGKEACRKIVNYAAKYSLKTYLPEHLHKTTKHAKEHVRALAWRQTWGIKAFSLPGFASVTLWRECRSKHYEKTDIDLVKYAVETNWVEFQKEFINIGRKNIKPIHVMTINKYYEDVKNTIGHFIKETNTIIAERISKAVIISKKELDRLRDIRLIRSEPSRVKGRSRPIETHKPEPPE